MKSILGFTLGFALLFVCSVSVGAEETGPEVKRLSLNECVARALKNSHTIKAERERLVALKAHMKELLWTPFSNFYLQGSLGLVPDKCILPEELEENGIIKNCPHEDSGDMYDYKDEEWGPRIKFEAGLNLPIYTFGKMQAGLKASKAGEMAKKAMLPKAEHKVRLQVTQAYNAVAGAREMLYTIGKGRKFLKKAREKVEADLESGEGTTTQIDLIKIQVFEGEVDQYEAQAKEIEQVGLAALRMLVGADEQVPIDIPDTPLVRTERELASLHAYKALAIDRRPELTALKHAIDAMTAKVDYRRAEFWPDFFLSARFHVTRTPGVTDVSHWVLKDQFNSGPGFVIGVGLRYQFDLGADIYGLKHAKAELAALTTDQQAALDGIMLEVARAYHHADAARNALESAQKSKKLVKGWVSAVLQNQAIGLANTKDVKDALKEYFKVMASLHKLTHDYNVGMAELDRVTGKPISDPVE